ncbi:MAG TPA: hypothetical protein VGJ06_06840 [Candidatus Acidoferrum sp.]|jgi:hypothetical protein
MDRMLFDAVVFVSVLSPPVLLFFAWWRFLRPRDPLSQPRWKTTIDWSSILLASAQFVVAVGAFLIIPCNVDLHGWECVARWLSFTRIILFTVPVLVILAFLGRKGTRMFVALSIVATALDCVAISTTA